MGTIPLNTVCTLPDYHFSNEKNIILCYKSHFHSANRCRHSHVVKLMHLNSALMSEF